MLLSAATVLFFLPISVTAASDVDFFLLEVEQSGVPVIKTRDVVFKTNLVFRSAPENFWIFYSAQNKCFVVDIYGGKIDVSPAIAPKGSDPFSKIEISNHETSMSLSGKQSRILLHIEPGWHFDAVLLNQKVIQITSWKTLSTPKIEVKSRKKRRAALYSITVAAASVATFLVIYLATRPDD
jgi:hypothetical protein